MNPTDKVDDLLAKAGRAVARGPAVRSRTGPRPHHRRQAPPVGPGAGRGECRRHRHRRPDRPSGWAGALAPSAHHRRPHRGRPRQAGKPSRDLLVRNGDRVEVNGEVIAAPGKQPCTASPRTRDRLPAGQEPRRPAPRTSRSSSSVSTSIGSPVRGRSRGAQRPGPTLVGIWSDQTDRPSQEQTVRDGGEATPFPPDAVPCPTPAGRLGPEPSNIDSPGGERASSRPAPTRSTDPALLYPEGASRTSRMLVMIGVAHGDLDTFRLAFEKVYQGNLCVAPGDAEP